MPLESDGAHWRFNRSVAVSSTCPAARRDGCCHAIPGAAPQERRARGERRPEATLRCHVAPRRPCSGRLRQAITPKTPQTPCLLDPRDKLLGPRVVSGLPGSFPDGSNDWGTSAPMGVRLRVGGARSMVTTWKSCGESPKNTYPEK